MLQHQKIEHFTVPVACWKRCRIHVFPDPGKLANAVLGREWLEKCILGQGAALLPGPRRDCVNFPRCSKCIHLSVVKYRRTTSILTTTTAFVHSLVTAKRFSHSILRMSIFRVATRCNGVRTAVWQEPFTKLITRRDRREYVAKRGKPRKMNDMH